MTVTVEDRLGTLRAMLVGHRIPFEPIHPSLIERGWRPGYAVAVAYGSKRLKPFEEEYTVGPSGSRTLVQLRAEVLGDSPDVGTATERGT